MSEVDILPLAKRDEASISARAARVNARLSSVNPKTGLKVKSNKPCFAYFGKEGICNKGDDCGFSHDEEAYKRERDLMDCPNSCGNYCKKTSSQCSVCVQAMFEARNQERINRKAQFDAREEKQCKGFNCEALSKYTFCKPCFEVNKRYTV